MILAHQIEIGIERELSCDPFDDRDRVVYEVRHNQVTNYEPAADEAVGVRLSDAHLAIHFEEGGFGDFRVGTSAGRVFRRRFAVAIFEIGEVDIHDAFELFEQVYFFPAAGIVYDRELESAAYPEVQCLENVGEVMGRGHEIDVMAAAGLEGKHQVSEFGN